jgi:hypothetical protein
MSSDDIALDFMSEEEVAEILATEQYFHIPPESIDWEAIDKADYVLASQNQMDLDSMDYDDLLMDAELDSDTN